MIETPPLTPFEPRASDAAGVISWVHIGDLHMTTAGQQNHLDLLGIVKEINKAFATSLSFVFLPGDVADQGSAAQYQVVREAIDALTVPWCCIVGDHDVHTKSFLNFEQFMSARLQYSFQVGKVRFFALNAFDLPDPGSFTVLSQQLVWLESGLKSLAENESAVLLLHCYPTELKQGAGELRALIAQYPVRLVEMGHTHYNEVANDGRTLYAATRSTGQIEEGPVGFSVTNVDGPVVSWRFLPLGELPAVIITSPADERFVTDANAAVLAVGSDVCVRAKVWSQEPVQAVHAKLGSASAKLTQIPNSAVWQGSLCDKALPDGVYALEVRVTDNVGNEATDCIRVILGDSAYNAPERRERDLENAFEAWPEHGLLATQLGPNKNGRKW
ncbi:MAG: metallophosphoesterase [Janthinobacterium lividum]